MFFSKNDSTVPCFHRISGTWCQIGHEDLSDSTFGWILTAEFHPYPKMVGIVGNATNWLNVSWHAMIKGRHILIFVRAASPHKCCFYLVFFTIFWRNLQFFGEILMATGSSYALSRVSSPRVSSVLWHFCEHPPKVCANPVDTPNGEKQTHTYIYIYLRIYIHINIWYYTFFHHEWTFFFDIFPSFFSPKKIWSLKSCGSGSSSVVWSHSGWLWGGHRVWGAEPRGAGFIRWLFGPQIWIVYNGKLIVGPWKWAI